MDLYQAKSINQPVQVQGHASDANDQVQLPSSISPDERSEGQVQFSNAGQVQVPPFVSSSNEGQVQKANKVQVQSSKPSSTLRGSQLFFPFDASNDHSS